MSAKWEYELQQFIVPRHGDEAFYDWDADDLNAPSRGNAKEKQQ